MIVISTVVSYILQKYNQYRFQSVSKFLIVGYLNESPIKILTFICYRQRVTNCPHVSTNKLSQKGTKNSPGLGNSETHMSFLSLFEIETPFILTRVKE